MGKSEQFGTKDGICLEKIRNAKCVMQKNSINTIQKKCNPPLCNFNLCVEILNFSSASLRNVALKFNFTGEFNSD